MLRLPAYRILMLVTLCAGLLSGLARPAHAQTQAEPLTATLTALQQSGTVGVQTVWLLSLRPAQGVVIDALEVSPVDPSLWQVAQPVSSGAQQNGSGPLPAAGADFAIAVIPQAAEKIVPAVQVRYRVGQVWQQRTVWAADPVEIRLLEDQVTAELNIHQKTLRPGALLDMDLVVSNRSALPLETLSIQSDGSGLVFTQNPPLTQPLGPFQSSPVLHLQARLAPDTPVGSLQPAISLHYSWKTSTGATRQGSRLVSGGPITLQPNWWESSETNNYVIGLLVGLMIAFLTRLIEVLIERLHEKDQDLKAAALNRERALAVLYQLVDRARISASIGNKIALNDMEILFSDAELFRQVVAMQIMGLATQAKTAAERFNEGITKPDGAHRKEMLLGVVDQLETRLQALTQPRKSWLVRLLHLRIADRT